MKSFAAWRREFPGLIAIRDVPERLGERILSRLKGLGEFVFFVISFFRWLRLPPFRGRLWIQQMAFIGVRSLPIILLTALFTGMVFSLQVGDSFRLFHAESLVGATVGMALAREIAPVFTSLMVVARAGSAMAAEIGTMKVTEQVEALESMAVNPVQYLAVPRVVAATLMVPCLTALSGLVGVFGAYLVAVHILDIPAIAFTRRLLYYVDADDFIGGLIKAAVFGFALSLISCFHGYQTEGGAVGVGHSTTKAVVASSVTILVLDYFLTALILNLLPEF